MPRVRKVIDAFDLGSGVAETFQSGAGSGTPTYVTTPWAGAYRSRCALHTHTVRGHTLSALRTTSGVVFLSLRCVSSETSISPGHHSWRIHMDGMLASCRAHTMCAVIIVLHMATRTSGTRRSSMSSSPIQTAHPKSENSLPNGPLEGDKTTTWPRQA